MSGNKTSVTIDRYPVKTVVLSCGCEVGYKSSPPKKGEAILCLSHGPVTVIGRKNESTQGRSSSNAA